jgi:hypothetical protein
MNKKNAMIKANIMSQNCFSTLIDTPYARRARLGQRLDTAS